MFMIRLQRKELLREGLCRLSDTCQRAQLVGKYEDEVDDAPDSLHLHVPHALAVLPLTVHGQPQVRGHAQQLGHMLEEAPHACMPVKASGTHLELSMACLRHISLAPRGSFRSLVAPAGLVLTVQGQPHTQGHLAA